MGINWPSCRVTDLLISVGEKHEYGDDKQIGEQQSISETLVTMRQQADFKKKKKDIYADN